VEEWNKKAFDFAQESTKLVITLATGVVALSITFMTDFARTASLAARIVMAVSWLFYIVSIICGVLTMYTLTGKLTSQRPDELPSPRGGSIIVWAGGQLLAFVGGIVVTVVAGVIALI
jgi:vacuolar-type H+-ATPase subunit I/STV1